jgi:hypothetical protein
VLAQDRIRQFHAAVDERFLFLLNQGFRVADRASSTDRWAQVRFERGSTQLVLGWEAYSGELESKLDGANLWPLVVAEGLWDAGRHQSVYMGYAVEAMQHGLDRIATVLKAHPELLVADNGSEAQTGRPER